MNLFIPVNQNTIDKLNDPNELRYWRILVGADDNQVDLTPYILDNSVSVTAKKDFSNGSVKLRNSGKWFYAGQYADEPAVIQFKVGNEPYYDCFTGFVDSTGISRERGLISEDTVELKFVDRTKTKGTKRKPAKKVFTSSQISDPSNPYLSILHSLAYEIGLDDTQIETGSIPHIKDFVTIGEQTAWKELQDLAAQFKAVMYYRYNGNLLFHSPFRSDYTVPVAEFSFNESNIHANPKSKEAFQGITANRVKTVFDKVQDLGVLVLYKNVENYNQVTGQIQITVPAGSYWPGPSEGDKAQLSFVEPTSGEEIPLATNVQEPSIGTVGSGSDIECEGGVLSLHSFNGSTELTNLSHDKAEIILYNGTGSDITIRKFEISGHGYRIESNITVENADPSVTDEVDFVEKEIPGKYATSYNQAHETTQELLEYGKVNRRKFSLTVDWCPMIQRGALVTLQIPGSPEIYACTVEEYSHPASKSSMVKQKTQVTLIEYADYTPAGSPKVINTIVASGQIEQAAGVQQQIIDRPTYEQIVTGWKDEGLAAFNDPADLEDGGKVTGIVTAVSNPSQISLFWVKDLRLTNIHHYEIQCSMDQSNWGALDYTGTGVGVIGSWTEVFSESVIHSNIPLSGTLDLPDPRTVFYRIRVVCYPGDGTAPRGAWSDIASGLVRPIAGGEIGAGAIYGENLGTDVFQADKMEKDPATGLWSFSADSITTDEIAPGAVGDTEVSFPYALSTSKGGSAINTDYVGTAPADVVAGWRDGETDFILGDVLRGQIEANGIPNNYWDLNSGYFRIGNSAGTKWILFDGEDIEFKSVDIELNTADLTTFYDADGKRFVHWMDGIYWKSADGLTTYGGWYHDPVEDVLSLERYGINFLDITQERFQVVGGQELIWYEINTYSYTAETGVIYYWNKIAKLNNAHGGVILEIQAKSDVSHHSSAAAYLYINSYANLRWSVKLIPIGPNSISIRAGIDPDGSVWLYSTSTWSSFTKFRVIARHAYDNVTIYRKLSKTYYERKTTPPQKVVDLNRVTTIAYDFSSVIYDNEFIETWGFGKINVNSNATFNDETLFNERPSIKDLGRTIGGGLTMANSWFDIVNSAGKGLHFDNNEFWSDEPSGLWVGTADGVGHPLILNANVIEFFTGSESNPTQRSRAGYIDYDGRLRWDMGAEFGNSSFGDSSIEINILGSGNRNAFIDFHSADSPADYTARIIQQDGGDLRFESANGNIQAQGIMKASYFKNRKQTSTDIIEGIVGVYESYGTSHEKIIYTIGDNWKTLATHYGFGYAYGPVGNGGNAHQIFYANNGTKGHKIGLTGDMWSAGNHYVDGYIRAEDSIQAPMVLADNKLRVANELNGYDFADIEINGTNVELTTYYNNSNQLCNLKISELYCNSLDSIYSVEARNIYPKQYMGRKSQFRSYNPSGEWLTFASIEIGTGEHATFRVSILWKHTNGTSTNYRCEEWSMQNDSGTQRYQRHGINDDGGMGDWMRINPASFDNFYLEVKVNEGGWEWAYVHTLLLDKTSTENVIYY